MAEAQKEIPKTPCGGKQPAEWAALADRLKVERKHEPAAVPEMKRLDPEVFKTVSEALRLRAMDRWELQALIRNIHPEDAAALLADAIPDPSISRNEELLRSLVRFLANMVLVPNPGNEMGGDHMHVLLLAARQGFLSPEQIIEILDNSVPVDRYVVFHNLHGTNHPQAVGQALSILYPGQHGERKDLSTEAVHMLVSTIISGHCSQSRIEHMFADVTREEGRMIADKLLANSRFHGHDQQMLASFVLRREVLRLTKKMVAEAGAEKLGIDEMIFLRDHVHQMLPSVPFITELLSGMACSDACRLLESLFSRTTETERIRLLPLAQGLLKPSDDGSLEHESQRSLLHAVVQFCDFRTSLLQRILHPFSSAEIDAYLLSLRPNVLSTKHYFSWRESLSLLGFAKRLDEPVQQDLLNDVFSAALKDHPDHLREILGKAERLWGKPAILLLNEEKRDAFIAQMLMSKHQGAMGIALDCLALLDEKSQYGRLFDLFMYNAKEQIQSLAGIQEKAVSLINGWPEDTRISFIEAVLEAYAPKKRGYPRQREGYCRLHENILFGALPGLTAEKRTKLLDPLLFSDDEHRVSLALGFLLRIPEKEKTEDRLHALSMSFASKFLSVSELKDAETFSMLRNLPKEYWARTIMHELSARYALRSHAYGKSEALKWISELEGAEQEEVAKKAVEVTRGYLLNCSLSNEFARGCKDIPLLPVQYRWGLFESVFYHGSLAKRPHFRLALLGHVGSLPKENLTDGFWDEAVAVVDAAIPHPQEWGPTMDFSNIPFVMFDQFPEKHRAKVARIGLVNGKTHLSMEVVPCLLKVPETAEDKAELWQLAAKRIMTLVSDNYWNADELLHAMDLFPSSHRAKLIQMAASGYGSMNTEQIKSVGGPMLSGMVKSLEGEELASAAANAVHSKLKEVALAGLEVLPRLSHKEKEAVLREAFLSGFEDVAANALESAIALFGGIELARHAAVNSHHVSVRKRATDHIISLLGELEGGKDG